MPYKAYTRDNPQADGIDLALIHRAGGVSRAEVLQRSAPIIWSDTDASPEPDPAIWFTLSDDAARSLYEALAQHYGHMPGDNRLLREDYVAERRRVDGLLATVSKIAEGVRS